MSTDFKVSAQRNFSPPGSSARITLVMNTKALMNPILTILNACLSLFRLILN